MWKRKVKTWQAIVIAVLVLETAFLIWAGCIMRKVLILDDLYGKMEMQNNNPSIYSKKETSETIIEQWQKLEKKKFVATYKNEDKKVILLTSGTKGQAAGREVYGEAIEYKEENGKKNVQKFSNIGVYASMVDNYFYGNIEGIKSTIWYALHSKITTKKVDGKVCYIVTIYPQKQDIMNYPAVRLDETAKKAKFYIEKERGLPLKAEIEYDKDTEVVTYDYTFDEVDDTVFQELEGYEEVK